MTSMPTLTQKLANPTRFMTLSARLLPWITGVAVLLLATGLVLSFNAPPDYQQANTVKIMFVHVPCAWLGMAIYALIAASGVGLLVFRHPLADVSAKAAAPYFDRKTPVAVENTNMDLTLDVEAIRALQASEAELADLEVMAGDAGQDAGLFVPRGDEPPLLRGL